MKQMYANLLLLDRPFYEIHEDNYDPLIAVKSFWDSYPLAALREYFINLERTVADYSLSPQMKSEKIDQTLLFADLLRVLIAYCLIHGHNIDLRVLNISTLQANKEELLLTKKIHDFFQFINQPNT